jgi:hypothetical protein
VNHENITTGFSQALDDISEDIAPAKQIVAINPDDTHIQTVVRDLYGHYLSFLADSLEWHKARLLTRIWKPMDQNFMGSMGEKVNRIKKIAQMMFQQANIKHMTLFRDAAISIRNDINDLRLELREAVGEIRENWRQEKYMFSLLSEYIRNNGWSETRNEASCHMGARMICGEESGDQFSVNTIEADTLGEYLDCPREPGKLDKLPEITQAVVPNTTMSECRVVDTKLL